MSKTAIDKEESEPRWLSADEEKARFFEAFNLQMALHDPAHKAVEIEARLLPIERLYHRLVGELGVQPESTLGDIIELFDREERAKSRPYALKRRRMRVFGLMTSRIFALMFAVKILEFILLLLLLALYINAFMIVTFPFIALCLYPVCELMSLATFDAILLYPINWIVIGSPLAILHDILLAWARSSARKVREEPEFSR